MEGVEGGAIGCHEPVLEALDLAADVRQRRAELVGHVGDHPAAQHLPALEGSGERIESMRELADFVPRLDRDALRQVSALHLSRGAGQRLDGAEDPARESRHREQSESGAEQDARHEPAMDAPDELRLFAGGPLARKGSGQEHADRLALRGEKRPARPVDPDQRADAGFANQGQAAVGRKGGGIVAQARGNRDDPSRLVPQHELPALGAPGEKARGAVPSAGGRVEGLEPPSHGFEVRNLPKHADLLQPSELEAAHAGGQDRDRRHGENEHRARRQEDAESQAAQVSVQP